MKISLGVQRFSQKCGFKLSSPPLKIENVVEQFISFAV